MSQRVSVQQQLQTDKMHYSIFLRCRDIQIVIISLRKFRRLYPKKVNRAIRFHVFRQKNEWAFTRISVGLFVYILYDISILGGKIQGVDRTCDRLKILTQVRDLYTFRPF